VWLVRKCFPPDLQLVLLEDGDAIVSVDDVVIVGRPNVMSR
jgi:hypothetical protein